MAVIYNATLRTNRLSIVNDAINSKTFAGGTGVGSAALLVIGTSSLSGGAGGVLVSIPLPNPAATVSGNTLTLNVGTSPSALATAAGAVALAEIRTGAGVVVVSGLTVGLSGTDIIVNSATVAVGQTITLVSGVITHPST